MDDCFGRSRCCRVPLGEERRWRRAKSRHGSINLCVAMMGGAEGVFWGGFS